jgi:hypothetical protein
MRIVMMVMKSNMMDVINVNISVIINVKAAFKVYAKINVIMEILWLIISVNQYVVIRL